MNNGLIVSVSPHYHKQGATWERVMRDVLIALIPALIASVIIFGFRSLLLVAVSAANCVLLKPNQRGTLTDPMFAGLGRRLASLESFATRTRSPQ